jgi:hypothetical protein
MAAVSRLDRWLDRTGLPSVRWDEAQRRRVEMARIATAAIMLYRVAFILDSSRFFFGPPSGWHGFGNSQSQFALFEMALAIGLLIGFMTPLCIAGILATYYRFNEVMNTLTLGNSILVHLLVLLLLIGAGSSLSVDAILAARANRHSRIGVISRLYRFIGDPSAAEVRRYLFLGLVGYWVLSLGALLNHASDSYWRAGDTIRAMLQSSYISRIDGPARALERASPGVARGISQMTVFGQAVFQLAMVVLIRWKWGYGFVLWWGTAFFFISLLALQLSYLPLVELCLWALIFGRPRVPRTPANASNEAVGLDQSTSPSIPKAREGSPALRARQRSSVASTALVLGMLTTCGVAVVTFPQTERAVDAVFGVDLEAALSPLQPKLQRLLGASGLGPPNVFNTVDLKMGDNWPVIYRVRPDGSTALVPLSDRAGHRMWYHWSDLIYIEALNWRRAMIDADLVAQHQPGAYGYLSIEKILLYDYRRRGSLGPVTYRIDLFRSRATQLDLSANDRFAATLIYSYTEAVNE